MDGRPVRAADGLFEWLYRRHRRDVYNAAFRTLKAREDAEDATQTTFLTAYHALERGHSPEKPRAWLLAIGQNVCRRRFRDQGRRPEEILVAPEALVELAQEQEPDAGEISSALQTLPPNHRRVLFLREVEGLPYGEIAKRLGLSHAAVEALLFRARRGLRKELQAAGVAPARFRGIVSLPFAFERLAHSLARPELAVKVAAAVTVTVIGTGVAIGTGDLPFASAGEKRQSEAPTKPRPSVLPIAGDAGAPSRDPARPRTRAPAKAPDREPRPSVRASETRRLPVAPATWAALPPRSSDSSQPSRREKPAASPPASPPPPPPAQGAEGPLPALPGLPVLPPEVPPIAPLPDVPSVPELPTPTVP